MSPREKTFLWTASALVLGVGLAFGSPMAAAEQTAGTGIAGDTAGAGARQPMERILAVVKAAGYSAVSKVEREHGRYEVRARTKQGLAVEIYVDPATGQLIRDPQTGKPREESLSSVGAKVVEPPLAFEIVVAEVKAEGYAEVYAINYEHALFEIKARDAEGRRFELYAHPNTGKLLRHPRTGKALKEIIED